MITVEVKLYGNLRRYRPESAGGAPHHPFTMRVADGATVVDLMAALGIPEGLTAVVSINKENADPNNVLPPDAAVSLFPPTAGG